MLRNLGPSSADNRSVGRPLSLGIATASVLTLPVVIATSTLAWASDLADALEWVDENAEDGLVIGLDEEREKAHDHGAIQMINSRDVNHGQPLSEYRCEDSPVDGFPTFRTNSNQKWALRACYELMWKQDSLPGFVTLGKVRLSKRKVAPWVEKAGLQSDVPPALLDGIIRYVSGYRPGVISERGHLGIMQLRPEVLAEMGIAHGDLLDPRENINVGAEYLRKLTFEFGSVKKALAAYRDGPAVLVATGGKMPRDPRYLWFLRNVMKVYYATIRDVPEVTATESLTFVWTWLD